MSGIDATRGAGASPPPPVPPPPSASGGYGLRPDGTEKGDGYFGPLKRPDGSVSTELSIGTNIDGKDVEIPALVPTLTGKEIKHLLGGGGITSSIADKAVNHAASRMKSGKSVWASPGETSVPPEDYK